MDLDGVVIGIAAKIINISINSRINPNYALEIHKLAQIICIVNFTKFFASPIRCSRKI